MYAVFKDDIYGDCLGIFKSEEAAEVFSTHLVVPTYIIKDPVLTNDIFMFIKNEQHANYDIGFDDGYRECKRAVINLLEGKKYETER